MASGHGRQGQITHDKHGPHNGGRPPYTEGQQFPGAEFSADGSNADNLEVPGTGDQFVHLRCPWSSPKPCFCGRYAHHIDSLIVSVDGACPGNGSDQAVSSGCGVYFGARSTADDDTALQPNLSFQVPHDSHHQHTSQRAELHAAIAGMRSSMKFAIHGGQVECEQCPEPCPLRHLIIKTDSAYIVNAMTSSIWKWRKNGWLTVKKTPVKNKDLWEKMLAAYDALDVLDVAVEFWHVPREDNNEADLLARRGVHSRMTPADYHLFY